MRVPQVMEQLLGITMRATGCILTLVITETFNVFIYSSKGQVVLRLSLAKTCYVRNGALVVDFEAPK